MFGTLRELELDAPALAGNPLGDPARRPLLLWTPPGGGAGLPLVVFLHGFGGTARGWTSPSLFQPTVPERLAALVESGAIPPVVGAFPDGATSLGGTQWIDAPAVGRYQSYVAEDVVAFVEREVGTLPAAASRAVVGKSSGGYGALCLGRDRPDAFGFLGVHAGDACFEYCYLPDLPKTAAALLGTDPAAWLDAARKKARETKLGGGDHDVLNAIAMAAHYSPSPGAPLGLELPFEPATARLRPEVWERWLAHDPVRFVPLAGAAFRRLSGVYVDCGTKDEFQLRWGTRMVVEALRALGVPHQHDEFEDGHMGTSYRFEASLRWIAPRLARDTGAGSPGRERIGPGRDR